jgi:hypothetical protein
MTEAGEGGSNAANPPPWLQLILKANYFQTAKGFSMTSGEGPVGERLTRSELTGEPLICSAKVSLRRH